MKSKDKSSVMRIYFAVFLVLLLNFHSIYASDQKKKWCWTRSMANEPTFQYDKKNGGLNWGFCQKKDPNANDNKYTAVVTTSKKENSETTSTIKIKLFGDLGKSEYLVLGSGFERGSDKKVFFEGPDLGGIQKIKLKLEGTQPYRCKNLTVYKGAKSFNFECLKNMIPCTIEDPDAAQCKMEAEVDGSIPYEVTVKTSDEPKSGTTSPILMNIIGKKGESQLKLLSENGFKVGKTKTKKMFINDVGEITGFKLKLSENGKWKPSLVVVKNLVTQKQRIFDMPNVLMINPGKNSFKMDTNAKKAQAPKAGSKNLDVDNPDGGLIDYNDSKRIINLKCDQKLFNPSPSRILFGPDYPTRKVNYLSVLARCPSNCHLKSEKVFGLSIHPDASPICMSALVDNAISFYGGIISISILPGLKNYNVPKTTKKINGIEVVSYTSLAKKSYTISKVDNVDIVEKDMRILDNFGRLSNEGRIEMRREGEWGTVCAVGNNELAAKRICKDLGYRDGEWKTPSDQRSKNFCRTFKSRNYCGAKKQIIHFSHLKCSEVDSSFNSCNKDLGDPKTCTHDFDSIIRCFNENYQIEATIPDGVIRLENSQKQGSSVIGRLEMYAKDQFLPVCNLGFNKQAGTIACKQMGFENGELITSPAVTKSFTNDIDSEIGFSAEKVVCSGTENKINECRLNMVDIRCKHDMDAVLKCEKGNGDVSGRSQYIKPIANPPPSLGKLGLVKIQLTCSDKGNNDKLRGDPGSIYLVECPANCGISDGTVWGTGIYTSNSHICKAAIHAGVIQNTTGGIFVLSRSYGQTNYFGSKNNGIISTLYIGRWPASISFASINSGYTNMNKLAFEASFLEKNTQIKLISRLRSKIKQFSSFLETEQNISIPTPIFEWLPQDFTFKFSSLKNDLVKTHKLTTLKTFSMIMRFKMTDFKDEPSYLFSYPGCNGLNVLLDENDNLVIGDTCNSKKRVKPGYMVPVQDKLLLFVSYTPGKLYIRVFSHQTKNIFEKTYTNKVLEFENPGPVGIGRLGTENKGFFYGQIDFIQLYDSVVDTKLIDAIINGIKTPKKKGVLPAEKTVDNRACVSPCTNNPTPGHKGAGPTPPEASLYGANKQNSSGDSKRGNGENGKGGKGVKANQASNFGTYDKSQAGSLESIDIDCEVNLNDKRFAGSEGMMFRVNCKTCYGAKGVVFGTAIYHPLSSICKAAYHSGAIAKGKSGTAIVKITQKQLAFNGSEGVDGSNSATFSGANRSFIVKKSPKLTKISCMTQGNNIMFSQRPLYTRFVVLCPKNCLRAKGDIYGTGIYSDNSSICKAAIHYGMIGSNGGEVQFIIENGLQIYKSSKGFGITSRPKSSHVRSFKFIGHRAAIGFTLKEDYTGSFEKRWKTIIHKDANSPLSNLWKYVKTGNFMLDGVKTRMEAIYHEGKVSVGNNQQFGSLIALRNAEWSNSIIKFNFMLFDTNPIGALLRFKDLQNFYAIQFNVMGQKNIRLIKRVEGMSNIVLSKPFKILLKKWYRVTILLNYDTIKLKIQSHNIRQHKTVFNTQVTGLSRGSLAFASNGNNKFYISGVDISEYKLNRKQIFNNNKRSWSAILRKVSHRDRLLYCRSVYNSISSEIHRCVETHNYCQLRCDSHIPSVENVLNFACTRDCVRTAHLAEGKTDDLGPEVKAKWEPKKNDKCDFLPAGKKHFRMCIVKSVKTKKNKKIVTLKYLKTPTKYTKAIVEYPGKRLFKCGEKLTARNDCKFKTVKTEN